MSFITAQGIARFLFSLNFYMAKNCQIFFILKIFYVSFLVISFILLNPVLMVLTFRKFWCVIFCCT
jgi:hypothetical protein